MVSFISQVAHIFAAENMWVSRYHPKCFLMANVWLPDHQIQIFKQTYGETIWQFQSLSTYLSNMNSTH